MADRQRRVDRWTGIPHGVLTPRRERGSGGTGDHDASVVVHGLTNPPKKWCIIA